MAAWSGMQSVADSYRDERRQVAFRLEQSLRAPSELRACGPVEERLAFQQRLGVRLAELDGLIAEEAAAELRESHDPGYDG